MKPIDLTCTVNESVTRLQFCRSCLGLWFTKSWRHSNVVTFYCAMLKIILLTYHLTRWKDVMLREVDEVFPKLHFDLKVSMLSLPTNIVSCLPWHDSIVWFVYEKTSHKFPNPYSLSSGSVILSCRDDTVWIRSSSSLRKTVLLLYLLKVFHA
jgi:hypothetical protein